MRLFTGIIMVVILTACNSDESEKREVSTTKSEQPHPSDEAPEMDFCDCGLLAIEKAKIIDSDPDQLEKYEEEFRPCKTLFDSIGVEERISRLMECPEVLERSKDLDQHIDVGGFLERARMKSDEVDADLKELEEMGADTTVTIEE